MSLRAALAGPLLLLASRTALSAGAVDYATEIKPLLRQRCYACHGALQHKGNLRLDTVAAMRAGGSEGPALEPGAPARSLVIRRVTAPADEDRMPPRHEGQSLTAAEVRRLSD